MRKIGLMLVLLMICFTLSAAAESLFVDNQEKDKSDLMRLNMRSQPRSGGAVIGSFYTGAEVHVLGDPVTTETVQETPVPEETAEGENGNVPEAGEQVRQEQQHPQEQGQGEEGQGNPMLLPPGLGQVPEIEPQEEGEEKMEEAAQGEQRRQHPAGGLIAPGPGKGQGEESGENEGEEQQEENMMPVPQGTAQSALRRSVQLPVGGNAVDQTEQGQQQGCGLQNDLMHGDPSLCVNISYQYTIPPEAAQQEFVFPEKATFLFPGPIQFFLHAADSAELFHGPPP